jgi:hypothetical protein
MRRILILAALSLLFLATPASATGGDPGGRTGGGVNPGPNGDPIIFAISDGTKPPPRGTGASSMVCTLNELTTATGGFAGPGKPVTDPVEGERYFVVCLYPDHTGFVRLITYQPGVNLVDAGTLARQAFRILPLDYPLPSTAPPRTSRQLVGVRTWLWIDPADFRPVSASVEIPGLLVTATATPQRVRWHMGDVEHELTCDGPGTPYDAAIPDAYHHTDCSYVFQQSGDTTITAFIDWSVTWTASDGTAGALPAVSRGSSFAVPVDQRQAVING